jgi:hypothetical protein
VVVLATVALLEMETLAASTLPTHGLVAVEEEQAEEVALLQVQAHPEEVERELLAR